MSLSSAHCTVGSYFLVAQNSAISAPSFCNFSNFQRKENRGKPVLFRNLTKCHRSTSGYLIFGSPQDEFDQIEIRVYVHHGRTNSLNHGENLVRPRRLTLPCSMQPLAINPLKGTLKICHGPIHNLNCAFCTAIVLPSKDLGTYCTTQMQPTTLILETHQSCLYFLHDCRTSSKRITCKASIRMADTHRLNPKTDRSAKRKIYDRE